MKFRKDKWEKVRLGDVCKTTSGGTPSRDRIDFYNGDIPWLKSGELHSKYVYSSEESITELGLKNSSAKLCPINSILIAIYGVTAGTSAILKTEAATNQAVCCIVPFKDKLDYEFLYDVITFKKTDIFKKRVGTYQLNISQAIIRNTEIPLPPLEEQKQIATLFQSLENAIEQVENQEKNLFKLKNQLLRELFGKTRTFGKLLSKNDFEKVKFEKIALSISERVEPQKITLNTYVGLEHLEPDNLTITRTGTSGDVIGTKLKIYKGDIIFGKRRAYQRKIAVSHFDGIASAHSMILRANEKNIEKEFLPFFMQSDIFMERAVQISEGSLSPTIKWKTLASQEFYLPKKEKQQEITEIFKQFDITSNQLKQQKITLNNLKQKLLSEILG